MMKKTSWIVLSLTLMSMPCHADSPPNSPPNLPPDLEESLQRDLAKSRRAAEAKRAKAQTELSQQKQTTPKKDIAHMRKSLGKAALGKSDAQVEELYGAKMRAISARPL